MLNIPSSLQEHYEKYLRNKVNPNNLKGIKGSTMLRNCIQRSAVSGQHDALKTYYKTQTGVRGFDNFLDVVYILVSIILQEVSHANR